MSNTNCNNPKCWAFDCSQNCKHMGNTNEKAQSAEELILAYIKTLSASIVYEDPYDYSAGVKCAKVDCVPESLEEIKYYSDLNPLISYIHQLEDNLAKRIEVILGLANSIASLMSENDKLKRYSNTLKALDLEQDLAKSQEKCSKYEGALVAIKHNLMNLQPHIVQACYPRHGVFIDNYVDPCIELAEQALKAKEDGN